MGSYTTLLTDVPAWLENTDTAFVAQVPTFISNGEARIYREANIPQLETITSGTLSSAITPVGTFTFPSDLIATRYVTIQASAQWSGPLPLINLGVGRQMYPSLTSQGEPQVYAVYDATRLIFFPPPDQNYPYELAYRRKLPALSASNATNWLTDNAYDLLLAAACCEGVRYTLDDRQEGLTKLWQAKYREALNALNARATAAGQDDYPLVFGSGR